MKTSARISAPALLILAALAIAPAKAAAGDGDPDQPQATFDDDIVVSATLNPIAKELIGSSVTVLDREEIEKRDKAAVKDLLRTVPGLEVAETGGAGGTTSIFIRGAASSSTLILIDGIRANNPASGGFDLADLTTDNIERIEVLRGPQSALYGSEAMGGVINIYTRRGGEDLHYDVRAEGGTDSYGRLRAGVDGSRGALDYSVVGSHQKTAGVSRASERNGNSERDRWENTTLTANLGADFADDGRVDFTLRAFDATTGLDGFSFVTGQPVDSPEYLQDTSGTVASATVAKDVTSIWRQQVRIGITDASLEGSDPDNFFNNFKIDSETTEVDLKADVTPIDNNTITLGYTYIDQESDNRDTFSAGDRLSSFYVQNQWTYQENLSVVVGVRNDDHSAFGDETTYRGAMSYLLPSHTRVRASYGTGFRAPTFNDLYFPGFGNPDLRPETSTGWDIGVGQTWNNERFSFDLAYFDNEFQDLIGFSSDFMAININAASSQGIEASFGWLIDDHRRWDSTYTWTDTEDAATGLQLARRPKHRFTTTYFLQPTVNWQGTLTLLVVADRIDSDGSTMDDYERLDLNIAYTIREGLKMGLRFLNLLDQEYEEINGFTTPGRQVALTMGYSR